MSVLALQHDPSRVFIQSLFHIERLLAAMLAGLVIFCLVAIGMYVITQLLSSWGRTLATSSRRPRTDPRPPRPSIDTWRTGGQRYTDAFVPPRPSPPSHNDGDPPWHTDFDNFDDPGPGPGPDSDDNDEDDDDADDGWDDRHGRDGPHDDPGV